MSIKRKGPRSADSPITTERMAELAVTIADQSYVLGPQDEADLVEALRELLHHRRTGCAAQQISIPRPEAVPA